MSTWYEKGIFYHMYPLGMTGAPKHNDSAETVNRFEELDQWIPHIRSLGCNSIYIGPLFESSSHGYDTRDYRQVDRRLGDNAAFKTFVSLCHEQGIRVVVDECFLALADPGEAAGLAGHLEKFPNLVLLRAFTKSYALPGLRLGYCLSADGKLLDRLSKCAQPWSVSGPTQAAGLAALAQPEYPAKARQLIAGERAWLTAALSGLGLRAFPSQVNYILFQAPGVDDLKERLLERGVLIRSCANYVGLGPDYYRVAVRRRWENEGLMRAMREVL